MLMLKIFALAALTMARDAYTPEHGFDRLTTNLEQTYDRYINIKKKEYGDAYIHRQSGKLIFVPYVSPAYLDDVGYMDQYGRADEDAKYSDPDRAQYTPRGYGRQAAHGVKDSLVGTVEGVVHVLMDPVGTAAGVVKFGDHLVKHPVKTAKAVGRIFTDDARQEGVVHTASYGLTEAAMLMLPGAAEGKGAQSGASAASTLGTVAKSADSVADVGRVGKLADTVSDVAKVAQVGDKLSDTAKVVQVGDKIGDTAKVFHAADEVGDIAKSASIAGEVGEKASRAAQASELIRDGARFHALSRFGEAAKDAGRIGFALDASGYAADVTHAQHAQVENEKREQAILKSAYLPNSPNSRKRKVEQPEYRQQRMRVHR